MDSNCRNDIAPVASWCRTWSISIAISSPGRSPPSTRWESISRAVSERRTTAAVPCFSRPLLDRRVVAADRADVGRARAEDPVVGVLLEELRAPAGDPGDGDDRDVELGTDAERGEERGGVEVDVGVQLLLAVDDLVQLDRHVEPPAVALARGRLVGHLPQYRRARVARLVDAVAEAHEAPPGGQGVHGERFDAL